MSFTAGPDEYDRFMGRHSVPLAPTFAEFAGVVAGQRALDVGCGPGEKLPYGDRLFDAVLAQLVVHFMADPVLGLREMARVTAAGGIVAACVWDHAGGQGPLSLFWNAARELGHYVEDEFSVKLARRCAVGARGGLSLTASS